MNPLGYVIISIVLIATMIGCNSKKSPSSEENYEDPFAPQLGMQITVVGVAQNLK